MKSGTGESRHRLHGGGLLRRSVTTRTSRLGRMGPSFTAMFVIVGVVIVVPVARPLLRIGMAQLRMRRIGTSSLLRSPWSPVVASGINGGNIILGSVGLLSSRATVPPTVSTAGGSGCRLRWGFTHIVGGDRLCRLNTREEMRLRVE
jgi:hypothetical protein